jgi:hypothetical protein
MYIFSVVITFYNDSATKTESVLACDELQAIIVALQAHRALSADDARRVKSATITDRRRLAE